MSTTPGAYEFHFGAEGIDMGTLRTTDVTIDEEVSRESRCSLRVVFDGGTLDDPRGLVGNFASVAITRGDGELVRRYFGDVRSVTESATHNAARQVLKIELASPLTRLNDCSDQRIFQELTTKEIVTQICEATGIAADMLDWRLERSYPKRVTCTQYAETTRAFVDRLLEEDGVCWYADHTEDGLKLIFTDNPAGFSALDLDLPFGMQLGGNAGELVSNLTASARVRPKKVTLRDHDFTKPSLDLEAVIEADTALGREHYEYPGGYADPNEGGAPAATVSAAQVAAASRIELRGKSLALRVGRSFSISGSPGGVHDATFVAVRLIQRWKHGDDGAPSRLETEASLLPSGLRFAPLATTPRPRVRGDLAAVTTPPGEEIHCDEHGRIKVQYHWDRLAASDDKSSGFHRVSQMHTSGSVVIPRKTWELLVEFEDGDPDRPIVIGRLYNGQMLPPDPLPAGKSNSVLRSFSTPGGGGQNELRMNDGGGSELVHLQAQKDLNLVVANDKEEKVTNSAKVGIGVDQAVTVGASQTEKVGSVESVTIGGSQKFKVGASRTKSVSADEKQEVKGARSVTIGASHTTVTPMSYSVGTSGNLTENVSGLCLEAAALGVGIAVAGSASISVGAAKIEAVATGKSDMTIGARATTVGGAFINATPNDITFTTKGAKVTTVGGAYLGNAGGNIELSSSANISITVGGAILMNAAKIVLKVGGSSVTLAAGGVVFDSPEVKFTASGPMAELAGAIKSK